MNWGRLLYVLTAVSAAAHGDQLFVEDTLVLSVYAEAKQGGGRIATIETGDAVEALERVDKFVRVRLADGREGWVGANYLSDEPPAILQLKALQEIANVPDDEARKALAAEIARLKKHNASLQSENSALQKKLAAAPAADSAVAPTPAVKIEVVTAPEPATTSPRSPKAVSAERHYAWAWLIALAITGSGGFVAGYQTLGRRVRQRFGGVKVY